MDLSKENTNRKHRRSIKTLKEPKKGRRFTAEQKSHALTLVASGMTRTAVSEIIGATTESIRRWVDAAKANDTMPKVPAAATVQTVDTASVERGENEQPQAEPTPGCADSRSVTSRSPYAPKDPAHGLSDAEVKAILEQKKKQPSMGPAQIRAQLKRFKGWRVSVKAIGKVLLSHGYELVHKGSRPKDVEFIRFEAPRRNALWQMDFAELRVADEKFHLLVALDDFSRFVVGHAVVDSASSEAATALLHQAMARHGKPEVVRTDRAGAFVAFTKESDFARVLEAELIDHIVGRSYHPQGGGKVESVVRTLRRELWDVEHFHNRGEAEHRLDEFFEEYNHRRAHMGIDGLTPADRYFGRANRVLDAINAVSRGRQGTYQQLCAPGMPFEETLAGRNGCPMEVLRLVIVDGMMELRFCGTRVNLGAVQS